MWVHWRTSGHRDEGSGGVGGFCGPGRTSDHRVVLLVIEVLIWRAWRTGDHREWEGIGGQDGFWFLCSVGTGKFIVGLGPGRVA